MWLPPRHEYLIWKSNVVMLDYFHRREINVTLILHTYTRSEFQLLSPVKTVSISRWQLFLHGNIWRHIIRNIQEYVSCSHQQACHASMGAVGEYCECICVKMSRAGLAGWWFWPSARRNVDFLIGCGNSTAATRRRWAGYNLITCLTPSLTKHKISH